MTQTELTPKLATTLLASIGATATWPAVAGYRPEVRAKLERVMASMSKGEGTTSSVITVDNEGRLCDGWTRAVAVVLTGVTIPVVVSGA